MSSSNSEFRFEFERLASVERRATQEPALPIYDITSTQPLPHVPDNLPLRHPRPEKVWLDGDVLMCACPDCRAPMSIRFWLMLADCWNCGTSIELSEQMERDARRLMQQRRQNHREQASPRTPPENRTTPRPMPTPERERTPFPPERDQRPAARPAAANSVQRRMERLASARTASVWVRDLFRQTPAWLVSLVLHLVALTILALLTLNNDDSEHITLSVAINKHPKRGGPLTQEPDPEEEFDLPLPPTVNMQNQQQREDVKQAMKDAKELLLDPKKPNPNLPDLTEARKEIVTSDKSNNSLALRDPRFRVEIVRREGGTVMTEAAVARGLRWLARHQNTDGSWSLGRSRIPGCNCRHAGSFNNDVTGTALALLPFLGAGQSHLVGRYKSTVSRGLKYIIKHQKENGDLRANSKTREGMYGHGQASIVLCEAYALTGDEVLRQPAQRAVNFIVKAQYTGGGWRYLPNSEDPRKRGDTSVLGWQLMALQSARSAKLKVPGSTFELAGQYLDTVETKSRTTGGVYYSYMRGQTPDHVMTAEALLCRLYLDWKRNTPGLNQSIRFLNKNFPPSSTYADFYYMYYCTQLMRHVGGNEWRKWNVAMGAVLVRTQSKRGHEAGSWTPRRGHDIAGGRLYATSLAICTLEVYYRFLPVFDPKRVLGDK